MSEVLKEPDLQALEAATKPEQVETERWYTGTVESAISNALLVRTRDTQKDIWIVVNASTDLPLQSNPLKKYDPSAPDTVRDMPRTLDDKGGKRIVEFAIKPEYFGAFDSVQGENARRIYAALDKGQDPGEVELAVPVVHAAKFANHRSQFFQKATAEQAGFTQEDMQVDGSNVGEVGPISLSSTDLPHVLRVNPSEAPVSGVRSSDDHEGGQQGEVLSAE